MESSKCTSLSLGKGRDEPKQILEITSRNGDYNVVEAGSSSSGKFFGEKMLT